MIKIVVCIICTNVALFWKHVFLAVRFQLEEGCVKKDCLVATRAPVANASPVDTRCFLPLSAGGAERLMLRFYSEQSSMHLEICQTERRLI